MYIWCRVAGPPSPPTSHGMPPPPKPGLSSQQTVRGGRDKPPQAWLGKDNPQRREPQRPFPFPSPSTHR